MVEEKKRSSSLSKMMDQPYQCPDHLGRYYKSFLR
jgi:hypothetical protein